MILIHCESRLMFEAMKSRHEGLCLMR